MIRLKSPAAILSGIVLSLLLLVACGGVADSQPTLAPPPTAANAKAVQPTTPQPTPSLAPTDTATARPPTATATPSPTPSPSSTPAEASYRVVYVAPDDELNVRRQAGVESEIVATLSPAATGLDLAGSGRMSDGSLWVPLALDGSEGWVNSLFLTESVSGEKFCEAEAPGDLLEQFQEAIESEDAESLQDAVDVQRGFHLRVSWWNPEVWLRGSELEEIFSSQEAYDWGVEDGSGRPIEGTFSDVILPLLQEDLLNAEEMGCNEILHGGTAGLVQLPAEYEGINYYSLFRPPGPGDVEMDWGTWVVGIEKWQGSYNIAFLVHFRWEI